MSRRLHGGRTTDESRLLRTVGVTLGLERQRRYVDAASRGRSNPYAQEAVAARVGVDRQTISRIENGHHDVSLLTFYAICDALDVAASEVMRRVEFADASGDAGAVEAASC